MRELRLRLAHLLVRTVMIAFVLLAYQSGSVVGALALPVVGDVVEVTSSPQDPALNLFDRSILAHILATKPSVTLRGFVLDTEMSVDLELSRFRVTTAGTRFVVGGRTEDELFAFDPDRVLLLRGHVAGRAGSHVVLALSEYGSTGLIDLGDGNRRYQLSGAPASDGTPNAVQLRVSSLPALDGLFPGVSLCGVSDSAGEAGSTRFAGAAGSTRFAGVGSLRRPAGEGAPLPEVTQQVELAIETDYEFYQLFGDLDAAAAYVVELYAVVNDIFLRDVNTRMVLTFVRLWDTPDDLFNEPSPLGPFRQYWNENMGDVHRDVAQFLSGRRDMPYGGSAFLSVLCGSSAYSVVGYILGFFSDPAFPGVHQYDIFVTAHELGHNCGTLHTHDYGVDTCNDFDGPPQRGTIMSYCSQTVSGGNSVTDLRFHVATQGHMRDHIFEVECVASDCNGNGIDDEIDIADETSADVNANGIPDECEDCNGNGELDENDIAGGESADLNQNGVPDECEEDCNGNGVPDDLDIEDGLSEDLDGNNVPDLCQEDCDEDGVSDYNEIQSDMSLDIDRNAVLDACQDCDGDGVSDLDALGGTRNVWVASLGSGDICEFHALSGVRVKDSDHNHIFSGQDVVITPEARIFVSSALTDRIVEFDAAGAYVGDFVVVASGGLNYPTGMVIAPTGNLLVASRDTDSVLEYDGQNGDFLRVFVAAESGSLNGPFGLAFGPNGNLFVTSSDNRVIEYDGEDGVLVGDFVTAEDNGGLLTPRGLMFKPDGNLIVASFEGDEVLEYDAATGAFVGKFNNGGTEQVLVVDGPWGLRLGWDGQVYVSGHLIGGDGLGGGGHEDDDGDGSLGTQELHVNSTRIYVFNAETGNFTRSYVLGNDTGLDFPTGFDFMPDVGGDCNFNFLPDSCDIASGTSGDLNANGMPDECECIADLNGDGMVGPWDLALVLGFWGPCGSPCVPGVPFNGCASDVTADCTVGPLDLALILGAWGPCQ
ncbi:MAG: hypothetical protein IID41_12430 [Planctomycetes bacterium]|nr:hypothetical protein [Planctomycetota bacterium]